jgi:transketolase
MSDDEGELFSTENIVMTAQPTPLPKKKKSAAVDGRKVKTEEARAEMLERLEKARVKALEVRQKNKASRDLLVQVEKDKVEKVANYLKNDDLFEKKYANQFERITNMLTNVETHLSEVKDIKKKKQSQRDEERALKEKAIEMVKEDLTKLQEAEAKVKKADADAKLKVVEKAKDVLLVKTSAPTPFLPNYRTMNFGRKR